MDRPNGGFSRGHNRGNNVRAQQQAPTDRPQQINQEDEWSLPTNIKRRDDMERCQTTQVPPPAAPPPTEERLFTNWSSEGCPRERANQLVQSALSLESRRIANETEQSQCVQSARSSESRRTVNQTEQPVREPGDDEVLRYILSDVTTPPSAQMQISQVGTRFIDRETNTSDVGIRHPREDVRTDIDHTHSKGVQMPSSHSELSTPSNVNVDNSMTIPHLPHVMLQLDGPASVCVRRRQSEPVVRRKTIIPEEGYPDESDSDSHDNRRHEDRRRHYQDRGGRPPERENNQGGGYPRRGRPLDDGGPPDDGDPLMVEDPLMMEDP